MSIGTRTPGIPRLTLASELRPRPASTIGESISRRSLTPAAGWTALEKTSNLISEYILKSIMVTPARSRRGSVRPDAAPGVRRGRHAGRPAVEPAPARIHSAPAAQPLGPLPGRDRHLRLPA